MTNPKNPPDIKKNQPPSEPNVAKRTSEHPNKPPSEPIVRKTTSDHPAKQPSEPQHGTRSITPSR